MITAIVSPPCGHYGGALKVCRCSPPQIQRYRGRISGPLLDRIDIHVDLAPLNDDELLNAPEGEPSCEIRKRVTAARQIQNQRLENTGLYCNAQMEPAQLQEFCKLDTESITYLRHSIREMQLSARAYDRILRVARTIADIEGKPDVTIEEILEAVQYRDLDKKLW